MTRGKKFRTKGKSKSIGAILGEGSYDDPQDQAVYDKHILSLCHKAAQSIPSLQFVMNFNSKFSPLEETTDSPMALANFFSNL